MIDFKYLEFSLIYFVLSWSYVIVVPNTGGPIMSERVKREKRRQESESADESIEDIEVTTEVDPEEIVERIDLLLDEIDLVLEENPQEFVSNYVQSNGE